jgi:hypothetical protein
MLLPTVLIDADHSALEDAVEALNGIGVNLLAAFTVAIAVLAARVLNSAMLGEITAKLRVDRSFIGHDVTFSINVLANERDNHVLRGFIDMERASLTVALNKGKNRVLVARASFNLKAVFATD